MQYKVEIKAEAETIEALALEVEHISQLILLGEEQGENYKIIINDEKTKIN